MRQIITDANKLRSLSADVLFTSDGKRIAETIISELKQSIPKNALGLSACQIGFQFKIFIKQDYGGGIRAFYNPHIIECKNEILSVEGCLSLPNQYYTVPRYNNIVLSHRDIAGCIHNIALKGIDAIVAQHECDHLKGVLISDSGEYLYSNLIRQEADDRVVWKNPEFIDAEAIVLKPKEGEQHVSVIAVDEYSSITTHTVFCSIEEADKAARNFVLTLRHPHKGYGV